MTPRPPLLPADRTPLVLHIERRRYSPPAARSWWRLAVVWLLIGVCVAIVLAFAVVAADAIGGAG